MTESTEEFERLVAEIEGGLVGAVDRLHDAACGSTEDTVTVSRADVQVAVAALVIVREHLPTLARAAMGALRPMIAKFYDVVQRAERAAETTEAEHGAG